MKILVLGSGGREQALAWRLRQDSTVDEVTISAVLPLQRKHFDLVVIGPEKFLFDGTSDQLRNEGLKVFGPSQAASFLESSKARSKQFMRAQGIPTSRFAVVSELTTGLEAIDEFPEEGCVLKLSGPALGKGVIVTASREEAKVSLHQIFKFKPQGFEDGVVIEEKVYGKEVSVFYICSGASFRFIASACDHKRLLDHDQGPNTGGMGAFSPCDFLNAEDFARIEQDFVKPTLAGMIAQKTPFSGMLFLGLMIDREQNLFSLLEYNTRFGDPETQTFLPLLQGSLAHALNAASGSNELSLQECDLKLSRETAVHVVKAAKGYPGLFGETIEVGQEVRTLGEFENDVHLFWAGARDHKTAGGRVLGVTAVAESKAAAREKVYRNLPKVYFSDEQFRTDIGADT